MPFNGSGAFTPPGASFPVVSGAVIDSAKHNAVINDLASGLSTCVTKDGQTTITADQPMGGFKHTGVGDSTTRAGYASLGQVQDSGATWAGTAGGTANAITLTLTPAISAYVAGQSFTYKSGASANTSTMTVAVSGQAAKAIQKNGAALASGDHPANMWFRITYDGAAFQLEQLAGTSAQVTTALALKANLASPTFTGTVTIPTATITGAATVGTTLGVTGATTLSSTLAVTGKITPSQTNGIVGTTAVNDAVAGSVGEYVSSIVLSGAAVPLVSTTDKTVTSISLTAGDWDVTGMNGFIFTAATGVTGLFGSSSLTTNATLSPSISSRFPSYTPTGEMTFAIPLRRVSISSTTTVYLVGVANFTGGAVSAYGNIEARRVR